MLQQRLARSLRSVVSQPSWIQPSRIAPHVPSTATLRLAPAASQRITKPRWYSSATEQSEKKEEEVLADSPQAQGKDTAKDETAKENPVQKELEAKKREVIDLTDRLKRQVAEYRNLQEQTKREVAAARDFALQKFAKDLLDSVDNLDRALTNVPAEKLTDENPDLRTLHGGLKMTQEILLKTLSRHGMQQVDPSVEGEAFDPSKHEATFQAPQPDKKDGTVFFTQQKGFLYNGRTLRAAKVGVVKNS